MIEVRRLHPSEFDLLKSFEDGFMPDPESSVAVVAENSPSELIGRAFLVSPVHLEGPFIKRPWRNSPVFKRLMDAIEIEARAEGVKTLMAYGSSPQNESYLERLGYTKMQLTVWGKIL